MEFNVLLKNKKIPDAHLKSVCKYGQGPFVCKFLVFYCDGFYCTKKVKEIYESISSQNMKAKGDNCPGL